MKPFFANWHRNDERTKIDETWKTDLLFEHDEQLNKTPAEQRDIFSFNRAIAILVTVFLRVQAAACKFFP